MAGLSDEGEAHGSFRHGQLAVLIPRRRPPELPQLLRHGEEQDHGHQAGGQGGQSRHEVEAVEQHRDGGARRLSGARDECVNFFFFIYEKDQDPWDDLKKFFLLCVRAQLLHALLHALQQAAAVCFSE